MSELCVRTMCTLSFSQRGRQPEEVTGSPPGIQKIPGPSIRGFLNICARYWVRTSEGKNFPSARGTNKSFPRRGRQPEEVTGSPPGTQKIPGSNIRGFHTCARYWDRTSDLFRVREARYRCANRAHKTVVLLRGEDGIRTRVHGFAGRCLTTRPPHRIRSTRERVRTLGVLTSG